MGLMAMIEFSLVNIDIPGRASNAYYCPSKPISRGASATLKFPAQLIPEFTQAKWLLSILIDYFQPY